MKTNVFYLLLLLFLASSCGALKVQYDGRNPDLPPVGNELAIATWDQREQILDGSQKVDFVGYSRSTVGIAYPITTTSGNPVADDISSTIVQNLRNKGSLAQIIKTTPDDDENAIKASFIESGASKLFLLKCNEHKIDGYGLPILHYELLVKIFDRESRLLLEKAFSGERNLGEEVGWGKGFGKYKEPISEGLEALLEEIFRDNDIANVLN